MINVLLILKISLIIYIFFLLLRIVGYHQLINYTQMYLYFCTFIPFGPAVVAVGPTVPFQCCCRVNNLHSLVIFIVFIVRNCMDNKTTVILFPNYHLPFFSPPFFLSKIIISYSFNNTLQHTTK